MMNELDFNCDLAKECLTVLSYCDNSFISKVPSEIFRKLNYLAADSLKDFYIDKNKPLAEQNISEGCKDFLGLMFLMYMADDSEKEETLNLWKKNNK